MEREWDFWLRQETCVPGSHSRGAHGLGMLRPVNAFELTGSQEPREIPCYFLLLVLCEVLLSCTWESGQISLGSLDERHYFKKKIK